MPEEQNYISLYEATKYCNYTQEYLSLRARQGKLKALKFGRNWVTKKQWLEEYLEKVEEYNNHLNNLEKKKSVLPVKTPSKTVAPPTNLPTASIFKFKLALRPMLILAVGVLLITGIVFGKGSLKNIYETLDPYVYRIGQAVDLAAKEISDTYIVIVEAAGDIIISSISQSLVAVSEDLKDLSNQAAMAIDSFGRAISISKNQLAERSEGWRRDLSLQLADVGGLLKEYGQWIVHSIRNVISGVPQK